jgi:glycerophosphoryl diester phosphodiesterase
MASVAVSSHSAVSSVTEPGKVTRHGGLTTNRFLVIAHRGASAYAPEHTMPSYDLARKMGVDYIEIDVGETRDGRLVAMHDYTVNRTTNGKGLLNSYTFQRLERLDAGSWFNRRYPKLANSKYAGLKVPSLDQIFDRYGTSVNYYLEVKNPAGFPRIEERMVATLRKHHLSGSTAARGKVIIESSSANSLKVIHRMDPTIPLIQLVQLKYPARITDKLLNAWKRYLVGVGINYNSLTPNAVQRIHRAGLLVHAWTVNNPAVMRKLIGWGVNGIFSDKPDVLRSISKVMRAD